MTGNAPEPRRACSDSPPPLPGAGEGPGVREGSQKRFLTPFLCLVAALVVLPACRPPAPLTPLPWDVIPPPARMPTYEELAHRHNRHVEHLERLWSRATITVRWRENGRQRWEQADSSNVILDLPHRVAVAIGSSAPGVGTIMWLGSDEDRYWLFDLYNDKTLYWGHHETVGMPGTKQLAIPVHPRDLPRLLGVLKIDADTPGRVNWDPVWGGYVLEPWHGRYRVVVDRERALPLRVDLLDAEGWSVLQALLTSPRSLDMAGLEPWEHPTIATRVDIAVIGSDDELILQLRGVDPTPGPRRLNPAQFDLETLMRQFRPDEVIQLDEPVQ